MRFFCILLICIVSLLPGCDVGEKVSESEEVVIEGLLGEGIVTGNLYKAYNQFVDTRIPDDMIPEAYVFLRERSLLKYISEKSDLQ